MGTGTQPTCRRKMAEEERDAAVVEGGRRRCAALRDRLHRVPESKLPPCSRATLLRLLHSELTFLHRLSAACDRTPSSLSLNIGHLEAVVHVLLQPIVTGVSRACKSINLTSSNRIYVDIVSSVSGNPSWVIVSDRNPRFISWEACAYDKRNKGLKEKIERVIDAARQAPLTLRPSSIVLFFSHGLVDSVHRNLECEFGAVKLEMDPFSYEELELDEKWTDVVIGRSFTNACVLEIEVDKYSQGVEKSNPQPSRIGEVLSLCKNSDECYDLSLGASLRFLVTGMKCWCCSFDGNPEREAGLLKQSWREAEAKLVNFDTTAMVAIVSGISNGRTEKLLSTLESELRERFKGNYDFVIAQAHSENQNPIHSELLEVLSGKQGIICESVYTEFQELVMMCGGPNEKLRAEYFVKFVKVVPDCPSTRLMSLPTTRKLAMKNKVVFGTGDYWHAPTVTANMGFVRAVSQTGMSLSVIEHRPQALIGD